MPLPERDCVRVGLRRWGVEARPSEQTHRLEVRGREAGVLERLEKLPAVARAGCRERAPLCLGCGAALAPHPTDARSCMSALPPPPCVQPHTANIRCYRRRKKHGLAAELWKA